MKNYFIDKIKIKTKNYLFSKNIFFSAKKYSVPLFCENLPSWRQEFVDDLIGMLKPEHKMILEVGCGDGQIGRYLTKIFPDKKVIGIDFLPEYTDENFTRKRMSAERLLFDDGKFDFVYSQNVFEHLSNLELSLSEIVRVLKINGELYTSLAPIWTHSFGHHWYTESEDSFECVLPPYSHLYYSVKELKKIISDKYGRFSSKRAHVEEYILGDLCNKLQPDDYRRIFNRQENFIIDSFEEIVEHHHNREIPKKLLDKKLINNNEDYKICGFNIKGHKE